MTERNFMELLHLQWDQGNLLCVGLDSEYDKIPAAARRADTASTMVAFNSAIVDSTHDLLCAYKPNFAFYLAQGMDGLMALRETIAYINRVAPYVPVILDAKEADIDNTNVGYVASAFDFLRADAITLHCYLGAEALRPFLGQKNKGLIILCRTSNKGAGEFQDLVVSVPPGERFKGRYIHASCHVPLYQYVAHQVANHWNENNNCAVVVGATYPEQLKEVREIVGNMPILIPGIGAQGGDVEKTVTAGKDNRGQGMIINSSRGIIFASKEKDFAEAARNEVIKLQGLINQYL